MEVYPAGGGNGRGGVTGGGYLFIPPPEKIFTVNCSQAHYGPASGGVEASRVTGSQVVVGAGSPGLGGGVGVVLVGKTGGGGVGCGLDGGGDGKIIRWEDPV